jgi:hypothetical protein
VGGGCNISDSRAFLVDCVPVGLVLELTYVDGTETGTTRKINRVLKTKHGDWRLGHLHWRLGAELGSHLGHKQRQGVCAGAWIADRRLEMIREYLCLPRRQARATMLMT